VTICRNKYLVRIGKTAHTRHHTQNVVIDGIDTHLGSVGTLNGGVGENKLQSCVINTREVARAGRLMLLGPQCERIQVDAGVRRTSVVLPRLDKVKVSTLTLREAILAVKLELSSDDRVLTPAMHVKRRLGKNEGTGVRDTRVGKLTAAASSSKVGEIVRVSTVSVSMPPRSTVAGSSVNISGTSIVEETRTIDVRTGSVSNGVVRTERHDSIGKSIDCVSVVEWLSAKKTVKDGTSLQRRTVVNILVGLHNPDKLLNRVVKVKLDLVGRGTDGLITSELELLNKILVGVLSHTPTLISVQKDIVNVERGGDEGLVVGTGDLGGSLGGGRCKAGHSPQALLNGADIKVNLDLVVLKSNQGKGQTRVAAEPKLKGDIEGSLRKSVTGSAHLTRGRCIARAVDVIKSRISEEGKLGGVTDHLEVATLLLSRHSKLVPDVHPVTVLAVDTLTTDLNLNLRNELLTWEIEPTSVHGRAGVLKGLTDLRKSYLKVSAVSQITITGDRAGNAATKVGLTVKSLLDRLHSEVSVTLVRYLPECNLGITSKVNVLCAIGDKLHKSSTHCKLLVILFNKKKKT
jgi:hypothetical protein